MKLHDSKAIFSGSSSGASSLALLILNSHIDNHLFKNLWKYASITICADGGANRLYDQYTKEVNAGGDENAENDRKSLYIPDLVRGDLDSLRPEVGEFFRSRGTDIGQDTDPATNDMEKCLKYLKQRQEETGEKLNVVALGSFGGRFDQVMGNINSSFLWRDVFPELVLISSYTMGFLLSPGSHRIIPDRSYESKICGLIPISTPCTAVTTTGLKWNLSGHTLEFGGLISTSNELIASEVTVENSHHLFWCTILSHAADEL
mmetsp:Transcript_9091/g.11823  ORF Transcript_9091/g.11823 Transcript_9091/m.11823 type:complete len:261 (+) Transcript_9091:237-1019(+)